MARDRGTTRIHQLGLSEVVGNLLRMRRPAPWIARHVNSLHGIELDEKEIYYFRENYVEPEEILPKQRVREILAEKQVVLDVMEERAEAIGYLKALIEAIREREIQSDHPVEAVLKGIQVLNALLTGYREDLEKLELNKHDTTLGMGMASSAQPATVSFDWFEEQLVLVGIDPNDAVDLRLRRECGWERLGERGPIKICRPTLADKEPAALVPGAQVSEGAVPSRSSGNSVQESCPDGGNRVADS